MAKQALKLYLNCHHCGATIEVAAHKLYIGESVCVFRPKQSAACSQCGKVHGNGAVMKRITVHSSQLSGMPAFSI